MASENRLIGLWRLTSGFHLIYLASTLCLGIAAFFEMAPNVLLRYLVDEILLKRKGPVDLLLVASGFVGLALVQSTFTFFSTVLAARTGEGVALRLRTRLFDHIQHLTFAYHDRAQTGDLIQRATSDVDALRQFFVENSSGLGRIGLLFLINLVALLFLNTRLALLVLAGVPLLIGVTYFFQQKISKLYQGFREQEANLSTTLQESLTAIRVVKAFARQAYEQAKFEQENLEQFRQWRRLALVGWTYTSVSISFCAMLIMVGSYLGAVMVLDRTLTLGTYLAYVGLMSGVLWNVRGLGGLIVKLANGLVSYSRVATILHQDPESRDAEELALGDMIRGEIVFDKVSFSYDQIKVVIKDISFRCKPGQFVALLGPMGSGKTSLLNLVPRFYEYTGGSVTLDGVELKKYPRQRLRRHIGIVEQEPFLFSCPIGENIAYGIEHTVSQAQIEAVAHAVAIHDEIASFPNGYGTLVGERGVKLSGGQKQRVAIARALLRDPRILILDDVTASVDIETADKIYTALESLKVGRTTFIITHRIQSVIRADLILVLDQGQITQQGTHAELIAQDGLYRRIYETQSRIEAELHEELARP